MRQKLVALEKENAQLKSCVKPDWATKAVQTDEKLTCTSDADSETACATSALSPNTTELQYAQEVEIKQKDNIITKLRQELATQLESEQLEHLQDLLEARDAQLAQQQAELATSHAALHTLRAVGQTKDKMTEGAPLCSPAQLATDSVTSLWVGHVHPVCHLVPVHSTGCR